MLELLLITQIMKSDYIHLTEANKTTLEIKINQSKNNSIQTDPQISPSGITTILKGLQPECTQKPSNPQIACTWKEKEREIKAYYFVPKPNYWQFQRWETKGFN